MKQGRWLRLAHAVFDYFLMLVFGLTLITLVMIAEAYYLVGPAVLTGWLIIGFLAPIWWGDNDD